MSLNQNLRVFKGNTEKNLNEGKESILLYPYNNNYYEQKEHNCFIEKIEPSEKKKDMWELTLLFKDGERATTQAYLDDPNIKEKTIVSIIGHVTKYGGQYQLFCRGITPIYTSIEELVEKEVDLDKFVKVSLFINLSNIEETRVFREDDTIQPLGKSGYYYKVTQKIQNMNNEQKMAFIKNIAYSKHSEREKNEEMTNNVETDEIQEDTSEENTEVTE